MTNRRRLPAPAFSIAALLVCVAAVGSVRAQQTTDSQSEAYRASVAQDTLKKDAGAIQAELAEVREAMRQLLPDDVATVDRAMKQMDSLSRGEMEATIQALRDASQGGDRKASLAKLTAALRNQGTISSTLKQMSVDLDARQSLQRIEAELSELVRRQVTAAEEIGRLGRIQAAPGSLHDKHRVRYDVANDDQKALSSDIKLVLTRINDLAKNLPAETREPVAKAAAIAQEQKLPELADSATKLANDGPLPQAAEVQNSAAKTLVLMEQAFGGTKAAERLGALAERLKKLTEQQQDVVTQVAAIGERTSVSQELRRLEESLGDEAAVIRAELQPLNGRAAGDLATADEEVEKTSKHFDRMWEERLEAQATTKEALAQIVAAKNALDQQIAQIAAQQPTTPEQMAAKLAELKRETAQAAADQARVAQGGQPPFNLTAEQQQALKNKVGDLQQQALAVAPDAAQELGAAASEMAQHSPEAQRAAAADLAQAAQALAQQADAVSGRAPGQQALARAEEQMAQAAQTAAAAEAAMKAQGGMSEAFKDLGTAQQQEAAAAQAAAAAGAPADAAAALQEAAKDLADAQKGAAEGKGAQAAAAAQAAQAAFGKAMAATEGAKNAMAAKAGAAQASKQGNAAGERQNDGGVAQGQGNGGGGKSGDFLAGAGDAGSAIVVGGLSPHDREAVAQLQNEKPPAQYLAEVQQYYKNIADGVGP